MSIIVEVLAWVFLVIGVSMYSKRDILATETGIVVNRVIQVSYLNMILSVVLFLLGAYLGK